MRRGQLENRESAICLSSRAWFLAGITILGIVLGGWWQVNGTAKANAVWLTEISADAPASRPAETTEAGKTLSAPVREATLSLSGAELQEALERIPRGE